MKHQAKSVMTKLVYSVQPETSMQDLKRLFQTHHISSAPVVDKMGHLVGVISKTNLLNATLGKSPRLDPYPEFFHLTSFYSSRDGSSFGVFDDLSGTVKDYMTKECFTIDENEDLSIAARTMLENRIHHLMVVKDHKVAGLISAFDVLKCYPLIDQLEHFGEREVRSIMKTQVITINFEQSLAQAKQIMEERGIRQLPVLNKKQLVGIITDRDIRKSEMSRVIDPESEEENRYYMDTISVGEVMSKPAKTIGPRESLKTAAQTLLRHKIGGMPVVDSSLPDPLVGIITRSDLLTTLANL